MSSMPIASVRRSKNDRVLAGVCAGIAEAIGVDPTLVRLVFTLLAFAGGAGIVLYVAIWLYLSGKGWLAVVAVLAAAGLALRALGLSAQTAAALVLIACGLALIWRRGRSLRPGASLSVAVRAISKSLARAASVWRWVSAKMTRLRICGSLSDSKS